MRGKRFFVLLSALFFTVCGLGSSALADDGTPAPAGNKTTGLYNRRAYAAHRAQIQAFRKALAGMKLDQMGDAALADVTLRTQLTSYKQGGRLFIEMALEEPDPMQEIMNQILWRYGFLNRHSGEWWANFNDWLHVADIFAEYLNVTVPGPPPIVCPTYFDRGPGHRINNDGSETIIRVWGWYCPATSALYSGACP
ncbi:MAG: hypothetical protein AB1921_07240 [Thermodesulfobacteriota bacterium]